MTEGSAMKVFLLSVLVSLCSAASFYVIEKVDNSRIKRAATTTVNPSLIDGQDIAGIRDGSDILTKDSNPIPGIDGSDIAGVRDGSDILTKDSHQGPTVDGRDIAGIRDGSDILTKDTNQGPTVDGRDIAGIRDGSDILTKDSNQGQSHEATTAEQPAHQVVQSSDHQSNIDTVTDSPSYDSHHGNQYDLHRNMFQYFQQYHETTTHDPEHETTTHDPEHATTADPDLVHSGNTRGWYNPLHMSRPGELPPMALPMTSEFVDKPIALPLTGDSGDQPIALPLTAESSHPVSHGDEASQNSQSGTDTLNNPENPLYMSQNMFPSTGETNVMPQALPLTGHLDQQDNTAPIALAQKGIAPSSTEKRGGQGRQFPGRGKQRPSAPPRGRKPGPGAAVKKQAPRGGGQPVGGNTRPPPNWGAPGQKAAPGTAFGAPEATPAPPPPSGAGAEAGPGAAGGGEGSAGAGGDGFMRNLMAMNMMRGGGGGDMFSEMMEMQRRMMRNDPQLLQQQMNMYQQMYQQMYPQLFGGSQGSGGEGGGEAGEGGTPMAQTMPMMPGMPMYGMGEEGGNTMAAMAMANGMNLNFQSPFMQGQLCQTNPDTPICKLMSQQANMTAMMAGLPMAGLAGLPMAGLPMGMGETQIEGPFGEMDMEPGELDIEGPIAHQLLMQHSLIPTNRAQQTTHPMHNEITLNHHVLKALQSRFGVNTTQGIQQMSTNPEFQAFMFQVLRQSQQSAPGEYHANLSEAQVNQILAGLNSSASGNDRVPPGNLNDATLQERPHVRGSPPSSHQAVLTLDSSLGQQASVAQPGTFQALVQQVMGTSTVTPAPPTETAEKTKAASVETSTNNETVTVVPTKKTVGAEAAAVLLGLGTVKEATGFGGSSGQGVAGLGQQNQLLSTLNGMDGVGQNGQQNQLLLTSLSGNKGFSQTDQQNQLLGMLGGNTGMGQGVTGQNQLTGMTGGAVVKKKGDNEIRNKDEIPGLSQDARNRAFGKVDKNKFGNTAGAGGISAGVTVNNQPGVTVDNRPIGLQEAGLFPGANDSVPVEKIQPSYSSSTAFAIAAIVLIAIIIVIGPVFCALCKMREKREEQRRKMQALKNREVSENNIMEAMMLHEFGSSGTNSVSNDAAMSLNYYNNEQTRYDTVDPEIECLNQSQPLP